MKDIELDGNKLEIIYKPKYHEMKAEEYKHNPRSSKRPHGFNAFKAQHFQSNKRKSSGGFSRENNKKNKSDAVVEESKKDESAPAEAETKEAESAPAAEETN